MLSRVANRIFWMSRHVERAENVARVLGVTSNLVLYGSKATQEQSLLAPLSSTGLVDEYRSRHRKLDLSTLIRFFALDERNPFSIYSLLKHARETAHEVRWQITSEMWETLNTTWLELRSARPGRVTGAGATDFFEWVKRRSHLFRGVTYGTILRGEAFNFSRLGTFLERADNTVRILDTKYYILLPRVEDIGGALDYYQWSALLRSVSAYEAYRALYRDEIVPIRVAELLILERRMPRSLAACFDQIGQAMDKLQGQHDHAAKRLAAQIAARLTYSDIEEIFETGVHEYVDACLADINKLTLRIERAYLGTV
ncbi:MAG: alpha-E domain-containing protein [bacterium]